MASLEDDLYLHILRGAFVRNTSPEDTSPITFRITYPPRLGTSMTRLPGGGIQTAEVVLPGFSITLQVVQGDLLPSTGAASTIDNASVDNVPPSNRAHRQGEQVSGDAPERTGSVLHYPDTHRVSGSTVSSLPGPIMNLVSTEVSPDIPETDDVAFACEAILSNEPCTYCGATGGACWCLENWLSEGSAEGPSFGGVGDEDGSFTSSGLAMYTESSANALADGGLSSLFPSSL